MLDKIKERLERDGFVLQVADGPQLAYSRPSKVGAPQNRATGQKVDYFIHVDTVSERVTAAIEAHNGDFWCEAEIRDMTFDYFHKHFTTVERRVMYAWRELSD